MDTVVLKDGITEVPTDENVFKRVNGIDNSIFEIIDTNAIYESYLKRYNTLARLDTHIETSVYGAYKFYSNGRFNMFFFNRNENLHANDFNPKYTGYRGIYYIEDSILKYDIFIPSNRFQWIDKYTGSIKFQGDTLLIKKDIFPNTEKIYIKRKLPDGYLDNKADW